MRAIDLYSGIGGWSYGLGLAGISTHLSIDSNESANKTNIANSSHKVARENILDRSVWHSFSSSDVIVGSPPCTEFSMSKGGGRGNFKEGLKHIKAFLEIVFEFKPTHWCFENVPRIAKILHDETNPGGDLFKFREIRNMINNVDMSEYGLAQSRKRCIVGNINKKLLEEYKGRIGKRTLGDVLNALERPPYSDPHYDLSKHVSVVTEHERKDPLDEEQERIAWQHKQCHVVYNKMSFPDRIDRPARTLTSLRTKTGRETIIIYDDSIDQFRLLTIREQATIQGFPINFKFPNISRTDKQRQIGNAMPPMISYLIGNIMLETSSDLIRKPKQQVHGVVKESVAKTHTAIETKATFQQRKFQFAVPDYNFGSGVRVELSNNSCGHGQWRFQFVLGKPHHFVEFAPNQSVVEMDLCVLEMSDVQQAIAKEILKYFRAQKPTNLDQYWRKISASGDHPFKLMNRFRDFSKEVEHTARYNNGEATLLIRKLLENQNLSPDAAYVEGSKRVTDNATSILSAIIVASIANVAMNSLSIHESVSRTRKENVAVAAA